MPSLDQANAFYREVASSHELWTISPAGDADATPTWPAARGMSTRPFWSSESRAAAMLRGPLSGRGYRAVELTWQDFTARIAPEMAAANQLVGVNWAGPKARGYNLAPDELIRRVEAAIREHDGKH